MPFFSEASTESALSYATCRRRDSAGESGSRGGNARPWLRLPSGSESQLTRHGAEISVRFPQLLACQASSALHQLVSVQSVEKKLDTPLPAASCHPFPTLRVPSIPPHPPQPVRSLISIQQPHNTPRPPPGPKAPSPHRKTLTTTPTFNNNRISLARLAQSVERETLRNLHHLKVVGSTPTSGSIPGPRLDCIFFILFFLFPLFLLLFLFLSLAHPALFTSFAASRASAH